MRKKLNKEELLKKFGLNVKGARLKKGLTQEEFADLRNIHLTYIARIETREINMSLGKILELANALNIDINSLLLIEYD